MILRCDSIIDALHLPCSACTLDILNGSTHIIWANASMFTCSDFSHTHTHMANCGLLCVRKVHETTQIILISRIASHTGLFVQILLLEFFFVWRLKILLKIHSAKSILNFVFSFIFWFFTIVVRFFSELNTVLAYETNYWKDWLMMTKFKERIIRRWCLSEGIRYLVFRWAFGNSVIFEFQCWEIIRSEFLNDQRASVCRNYFFFQIRIFL